jgi:hypothetical protein
LHYPVASLGGAHAICHCPGPTLLVIFARDASSRYWAEVKTLSFEVFSEEFVERRKSLLPFLRGGAARSKYRPQGAIEAVFGLPVSEVARREVRSIFNSCMSIIFLLLSVIIVPFTYSRLCRK